MDARKLLTVIGAGVTSFLLVAVLVIELLDFEFSAIIGFPAGCSLELPWLSDCEFVATSLATVFFELWLRMQRS
jgi:hypothetical protein